MDIKREKTRLGICDVYPPIARSNAPEDTWCGELKLTRVCMRLLLVLLLLLPIHHLFAQEQKKPRFVLSTNHTPGGYEVKARCIDPEYGDDPNTLNAYTFRWGVKYPSTEIRWVETNSDNFVLQLPEQQSEVTLFLQIKDANGSFGEIIHTSVNPQAIYYSLRNNYIIDSKGNLYKEEMKSYNYKYARLFVKYTPNLQSKYLGREWMIITAKIISPNGTTRTITVQNGGLLIKDIIPISEINWIKENSFDGDVHTYVIGLKNSKRKIIQYLPVYFTFKTL